ncbi:MAG: cell wall/surface repeat protein [Gemmatimonadetes bacterium]|nr:cell wall/surface repeat protein [Gemmatimonadota bacterium]
MIIARTLRRVIGVGALMGSAVPLSAQGVITVRAGAGTPVIFTPGTSVAVPIVLDMSAAAGANVASLSSIVQWSPTRLTLDSVKAGSFGSVVSNTTNSAAGEMSFSLFNSTGTTSTITALTLYFSTTSGSTSILVKPTAAGDELGANIFAMVRARWQDVCVSPGGLWGDANADGNVNIIDAQQLARFTVGLAVANAAAVATHGDVTSDNVVNIIDAQQLARYSVGLSASARVNTSLFTPATVTSITVPTVYEALGGSLNYQVQPGPAGVGVGGQAQLRPMGLDAGNTDVTSCGSITYASSAPSIATISTDGLLQGVSPGSVTITVASGGASTTRTFTIAGTFSIAASESPISTGTIAGAGTYATGDAVTLTATAASGYTFSNWTESGVVVATSATYTFSAVTARTLVANFVVTPTTSGISLSREPFAGGSVSGAGSFATGSVVTVIATANNGYNFVNWTEAGVVVSTSAHYSFTLTADRTLVATYAQAPVGIGITAPTGQFVGDAPVASATVTTALYALASVNAVIGGRTFALTKVGNEWTGTLNLAGLPRDTMTLSIVGTDANGGVGTGTQLVTHDRPPTVTMTRPGVLEATQGSLTYAATCSDDDTSAPTCTGMMLLIDGVVARSTAAGDFGVPADVRSHDGNVIDVRIIGTDSRGQIAGVTRQVYVTTSSALSAVGTFPGLVVDAAGTRALIKRGSLSSPTAAMVSLSTGVEDSIPLPAGAPLLGGYVTPLGAMVWAGHSTSDTYVYDWRSGALTLFPGLMTYVDVRGNYALVGVNPTGPTTLVRRDLTTGTDVTITTNTFNSDQHMGTDGSVAYSGRTDSDIYLYKAGTTTRITNNNGADWANLSPVSDGTNVVFRRQSICCSPGSTTHQLMLHDGTTTTLLATRADRFDQSTSYDVNAGWTAFTTEDGSQILQLWTRSPAGVVRKVSSFATNVVFEALRADGTVIFRTSTRRYLATAAGAPQDVGAALGAAVLRNGEFLVVLGSTVLKINP